MAISYASRLDRTSRSRQRLSFDSGRVSSMRTRSPTFAVFPSSWAWNWLVRLIVRVYSACCDAALDLDHDRLVHLVGDHAADLRRSALCGPRGLLFRLGHFPPLRLRAPRARRYVLTRARSRRTRPQAARVLELPGRLLQPQLPRRFLQLLSPSRASSPSPCWASVSRSFFFIGSPSPTRGSPDAS